MLFADHETAHGLLSVDGAYLAVPNVGVLGSHGAAAAAPLLATLLAFGRAGIAEWVDHCMDLADELVRLIDADEDLVVRSVPRSGVGLSVPTGRRRSCDGECGAAPSVGVTHSGRGSFPCPDVRVSRWSR